MSYSAVVIANEFIKLSQSANDQEHEVTNMKLQKLVYIAHGYYLGVSGQPLIHNDIHAFEWGPVIPVLYKRLKSFGSRKVDSLIATNADCPEDVLIKAVISIVWHDYGQFDGLALSRLTHKPNTPWSETWGLSKHGVITNKKIQDYYRKFISERTGITL